jgi:hypothetical protein
LMVSRPSFPTGLPPLPPIDNEAVLQQVYRHRSFTVRINSAFEDPEGKQFNCRGMRNAPKTTKYQRPIS